MEVKFEGRNLKMKKSKLARFGAMLVALVMMFTLVLAVPVHANTDYEALAWAYFFSGLPAEQQAFLTDNTAEEIAWMLLSPENRDFLASIADYTPAQIAMLPLLALEQEDLDFLSRADLAGILAAYWYITEGPGAPVAPFLLENIVVENRTLGHEGRDIAISAILEHFGVTDGADLDGATVTVVGSFSGTPPTPTSYAFDHGASAHAFQISGRDNPWPQLDVGNTTGAEWVWDWSEISTQTHIRIQTTELIDTAPQSVYSTLTITSITITLP